MQKYINIMLYCPSEAPLLAWQMAAGGGDTGIDGVFQRLMKSLAVPNSIVATKM